MPSRLYVESLAGLEKEHAQFEANFQARQRDIEQVMEATGADDEELQYLTQLNLKIRDQEEAVLRVRDAERQKRDER